MVLTLGDIEFRIVDDPDSDDYLFIEFFSDDDNYVLRFSKEESNKLHDFLGCVEVKDGITK